MKENNYMRGTKGEIRKRKHAIGRKRVDKSTSSKEEQEERK